MSDNLSENGSQNTTNGASGAESSTYASAASKTTTSAAAQTPVVEEVMYCYRHPDVETRLRCNRCGKPICLKCAKLTDVGYRCPDCIRSVQDKYFNAKGSDNLIALGVATLITAIAAPIAGILFRLFPFFFINLIIAVLVGGSAGGVLSQIIRRSVGKRRSRQMRFYALGGIIIGGLLGAYLASMILGLPIALFFSIPMLIFVVLAASSTYQLLR